MDPRVTPDLICNAIRDGKIDFILMSRPLMADGHYCKKLKLPTWIMWIEH
jgi:2,4-dienoyl-CoA reductase-like NADH-dependent reductase (Old Yellow Enzyme family)